MPRKMAGLFGCPESPVWLAWTGQAEAARQAACKLTGQAPQDPDASALMPHEDAPAGPAQVCSAPLLLVRTAGRGTKWEGDGRPGHAKLRHDDARRRDSWPVAVPCDWTRSNQLHPQAHADGAC